MYHKTDRTCDTPKARAASPDKNRPPGTAGKINPQDRIYQIPPALHRQNRHRPPSGEGRLRTPRMGGGATKRPRNLSPSPADPVQYTPGSENKPRLPGRPDTPRPMPGDPAGLEYWIHQKQNPPKRIKDSQQSTSGSVPDPQGTKARYQSSNQIRQRHMDWTHHVRAQEETQQDPTTTK